mmetsp:Transcript_14978/g.22304  ORF Transcript_14978/g.22304 Transcript_14978/m.22304 type:complete len:328 (-) Transcript_14978:250-1233(-)
MKISAVLPTIIISTNLLSFTTFAFIPSFIAPRSSPIRHYRYLPNQHDDQRCQTKYTAKKATTSLFSSISLPHLSESDMNELSTKGYVIIPDYIDSTLINKLRQDISNLRSTNKFNVAKIGQDATNTLNTNIRVAETCFLGRDKLSEQQDEGRNVLYDVLDTLRNDLSSNSEKLQSFVLDNKLSELLYAYYPQGGFYRRHRDAIPGSASVLRCFSLLLYLNDGWTEKDGGQLRMHMDGGGDSLPEGAQPNYLDVEPRGGTLVLFKSDAVPHEVLNTNSERMAVVGWFNRAVTAGDVANLTSEEDRSKAVLLLVAAGLVTVGLGMIVMG